MENRVPPIVQATNLYPEDFIGDPFALSYIAIFENKLYVL